MGVRKTSWHWLLAGLAATWPVACSCADDGNSVSGSVIEAGKGGKPLQDVRVVLDQDKKKENVTDKRGRYGLAISSTINPATLVFTKLSYTGITAHIKNDQSTIKLDDLFMAKQGTLSALPVEQLDAIVKNTLQTAKLAEKTRSPQLMAVVNDNLKMFAEELKDPPAALKEPLAELGKKAVDLGIKR